MVPLTDADVWESNNRALDRFASSSPWEECESGRDDYTRHTLPATTLRIAAATPPNQVDDGNAYVFNHISPTNAIEIIY